MVKNIRKKIINEINPLIEKNIIFKKKEIISNQNTIKNYTYILLSGKIKISYILSNGIEITLGVYTDKNIILSAYSNKYSFISLFKIEALEECLVGIVPVKSIENNIQVLKVIVEYYDIIFRKVYLQMIDLLSRNKLERLYSILIRLANTYGIEVSNGIQICIKLTNINLAEYIGTSPETICRLISKMKTLNLIEFENKYIILTNIQYMKEKLGCYHCIEELCIV